MRESETGESRMKRPSFCMTVKDVEIHWNTVIDGAAFSSAEKPMHPVSTL